MKFFFAFFSLLFLASCNDAAYEKPATQTIGKRDSAIINPVPANPYAPVDISPMDMSYFPADYPILEMSKKTARPPMARVIYSRPHKQGRKIFGSLLKYGEPWRLGANEATEIEFFQPATIQNKNISKGRYVLYAIPQENNWTIVFNKNLDTWGLKQDPSKDLYRFTIPVQHSDTTLEYYTMVFEPTKAGADLLMGWDNVTARLPIQFK